MTAHPSLLAFTTAANQGAVKTYFDNQRSFLTGLLGEDGTQAAALAALGALGAGWVTKTSAYTVLVGDRGKVIAATSGTWTLSLPAVASAGAGWLVLISNTGSGTITIDPNGTEQIDGALTTPLAAGRAAILYCTGAAWVSFLLPGAVTSVSQSTLETTPGRLVRVGDYGLGTGALQLPGANVDSAQVPGLYYGLGGAHVSASSGSNPFPTLNGAFSVQVSRAPLGAADEYLTQLAIPFKSTASAGNFSAARVRSKSTTASGWSAWQELLSLERLLGPVSQSGGVPTGRVIERGSNANGEYVRFADGTQICAHRVTVNLAIGSGFLGGFRTAGQNWTYPAAFATAPAMGGYAENATAFGVVAHSTPTTATGMWAATAITSQSAADRTVSLIAIGRWF